MNNDLISREAAIAEITSWIFTDEDLEGEGDEYQYFNRGLKRAIKALAKVPAVEAEPVRHGLRTVYTIWHTSAWGEIHTKFECCGFDVKGTKKYNYCPNCGAKMDGGTE